MRGAPNPCALPIESSFGPFWGFGEGQENLGGNRADGLPAWFRLPSASPGGGFGSCSHRDVACEPRRTADLVTVPLLLLRVRLPLSGLLWRWTMPGPDRSSWVWHRPCQSAMRRSPYPAGIEGWSTKKRLWRGGTLSKASSHIHTGGGDSACFVLQDPPTLLLFTTLSSISHSRRPKSMRPADRIRIRPIWGCWGGSRIPRWGSCRRPPGLVPAPFGLSWRRLRVLFTPGRGLRATAHC